MTFKISARIENLHVMVVGEFSLDEAKRGFLDVVDAIKKYELGKVLVDGRDIIGEPRILERFFYGHFTADTVQGLLDRGWKGPSPQIAYVLEEPVLDRFRLGEAVAVSRGMNVRAFNNPDDALVWLLPGLLEVEDTAELFEFDREERAV